MAEHQPSKLRVAGSTPVSRSSRMGLPGRPPAAALDIRRAHVAQSVERVLGKDEVSGSIPLVGSSGSIRSNK